MHYAYFPHHILFPQMHQDSICFFDFIGAPKNAHIDAHILQLTLFIYCNTGDYMGRSLFFFLPFLSPFFLTFHNILFCIYKYFWLKLL